MDDAHKGGGIFCVFFAEAILAGCVIGLAFLGLYFINTSREAKADNFLAKIQALGTLSGIATFYLLLN